MEGFTVIKTTTAAAILGAIALLTAGCSGDSGTDGSSSPEPTSATPAEQTQPTTIPAKKWATEVDALCAEQITQVSKIPDPDPDDSASITEYLGQIQALLVELSTDISAVGVPDQNADEAAELADYFAQSAEILGNAGPNPDRDAIGAEINKLAPNTDALAEELNVPSCGG